LLLLGCFTRPKERGWAAARAKHSPPLQPSRGRLLLAPAGECFRHQQPVSLVLASFACRPLPACLLLLHPRRRCRRSLLLP
jgi:hypothetical protein